MAIQHLKKLFVKSTNHITCVVVKDNLIPWHSLEVKDKTPTVVVLYDLTFANEGGDLGIFNFNGPYTTFIMAERSAGVGTNHIRARQVRPLCLSPKGDLVSKKLCAASVANLPYRPPG